MSQNAAGINNQPVAIGIQGERLPASRPSPASFSIVRFANVTLSASTSMVYVRNVPSLPSIPLPSGEGIWAPNPLTMRTLSAVSPSSVRLPRWISTRSRYTPGATCTLTGTDSSGAHRATASSASVMLA